MKFLALALAAIVLAGAVNAADTLSLPPPQKTGGPDLFTAIDQRGSPGHNDFPKKELAPQDVATICWAATGLNRDGKKWTVPMGMGVPPYCNVFYADKSGAYRYNWKNHTLEQITDQNIIPLTVAQGFAKAAPAVLYIAEDAAAKAKISNSAWATEFTVLLAGAMSQNVYLAAQGVGVGARLVYSIDRDLTAKLLKLPAGDTTFFGILLGKN